jgi:hypothetical protein
MATEYESPEIVDVDAMPPPRRGPRGWDDSEMLNKLRDGLPHAIENVSTEEDRKRWRRRVRLAARRVGVSVTTRYVPNEARLYFQGETTE